MRLLTATALAAAIALAAGPVSAQQIGIGTMGQGTSGYSMGSAIAKLLGEKAQLGAVVQPAAGTSAYLPLLDSGELDFGIANVLETEAALNGEAPFNRKLENVRMVAILFPFRAGIFARKDSGIVKVTDLKGKRVAYGFTSQVTLKLLTDAFLANGGLTPSDIEPVLVPNVVRGADEVASGGADAAMFAIGSGKVSEVDASVGGVQFIEMSDDPQAVAAMQKIAPPTYITVVQPAPNLAGISKPIKTMAYDYALLAGKHVSDKVVEQVVKTLAENKQALVESFAPFRGFAPDKMAKPLKATYHPGAVAYYKSQNQWPPK
ncbi:MAG TPA: TAXI family TRAP transporter solute-binding subunit [Alphaproteobacteria bacterium]